MHDLSTRISACRCCGSPNLDLILDLGAHPPANGLRHDVHQVLPRFALELCRCSTCATVQLTETVNPEHLFQSYVWVTGTSRLARDYSLEFCDRFRAAVAAGAPRPLFVVEIASNDGTFLRRFRDAGDRVLGIDPARNLVERANAAGIPTWADFFRRDVARRVRAKQGLADFIFARNVLPHVHDPLEILQGMADCLHAEGLAAVEFHHAQVILEELHYDSIYHEHLTYFSLKTLGALLERAGLHAFDAMPSPISGGSLVVACAKSPRPAAPRLAQYQAEEEKSGTNQAASWMQFAQRSRLHRDRLRGMVEDEAETRPQGMIGYGASARGSTLSNFAGINHRHLRAIADRNPLKQGSWTPGADVRVLSPADALAPKPSCVLLLAWNFRAEILAELKERGFRGKVILPLPGDPRVEEIE